MAWLVVVACVVAGALVLRRRAAPPWPPLGSPLPPLGPDLEHPWRTCKPGSYAVWRHRSRNAGGIEWVYDRETLLSTSGGRWRRGRAFERFEVWSSGVGEGGSLFVHADEQPLGGEDVRLDGITLRAVVMRSRFDGPEGSDTTPLPPPPAIEDLGGIAESWVSIDPRLPWVRLRTRVKRLFRRRVAARVEEGEWQEVFAAVGVERLRVGGHEHLCARLPKGARDCPGVPGRALGWAANEVVEYECRR